jgi:glycosyltransferase involved in cell wall biosynthesis
MGALEAMAAGKAVLATRTGGIPEFARHDHNSLLVPAGDTAALTAGLLSLCGSAPLRARLGRSAAASASRFCWDKAAAAYLRAYNSKP